MVDAVVCWLARWTPDRKVQVRALAGSLCCEGLDGGYKCQLSVKISAICQLSAKFLAICQLSVNWLLIINYAS